jgi:hypothetical protein
MPLPSLALVSMFTAAHVALTAPVEPSLWTPRLPQAVINCLLVLSHDGQYIPLDNAARLNAKVPTRALSRPVDLYFYAAPTRPIARHGVESMPQLQALCLLSKS